MIAGMTSIERFALRMRRHQRLSEIYFDYDLIVMPSAAYSPGKTKARALNVAGSGSIGALQPGPTPVSRPRPLGLGQRRLDVCGPTRSLL
jgi:hypothetical protein